LTKLRLRDMLSRHCQQYSKKNSVLNEAECDRHHKLKHYEAPNQQNASDPIHMKIITHTHTYTQKYYYFTSQLELR